jgi:HAD superfamily 5'-nucleotidase-like hydrolase
VPELPASGGNMEVFVNRTLNLKKIKYIGLDMDHTLIRYNTREFEGLSHSLILDKLVNKKHYPKEVLNIKFDFELAIRGLVLDRKRGNLLKLSRHGAIRKAHHGTRLIPHKEQNMIYRSTYIDLGDPDYLAIDTNFSISLATLFAQLVDLKDEKPQLHLPEYKIIAEDVLYCLDEAHRDNTLKSQVQKDLGKYVIVEPELVTNLEKFKRHGRKLFLATNSDYHYSKALLDYAIQPHLEENDHWSDLFEYVITLARKPRFFVDKSHFLRVDPKDGSMTNWDQPLTPGIYQGGCASIFTDQLGLEGDQILYIGDHIYGDILRLKKDCNWRTAMVLEELEEELQSNAKAQDVNERIEELMRTKDPLEAELTNVLTIRTDHPDKVSDDQINDLKSRIKELDKEVSDEIIRKQSLYNEHWGQIMRAGNEESYLAYQVDRYACIYMPHLADLFTLSPRQYFRAFRRPLAHEAVVGLGDGVNEDQITSTAEGSGEY